MESLLRLHRHRTGNLVRLDEYLYRRSGGMIDSLSQLVRGAAISNSYSTASRSTTPPNAAILHHGHRRRGSRAMRKASTAVSSSLAITEHLGLRLAGDPQLAEFLLRQAEAARNQRITSVA